MAPYGSIAWSPDGKFIIYAGGPKSFFQKTYYIYSFFYGTTRLPYWFWIKEIETGKEKYLNVEPLRSPAVYWVE